MTDSQDRWTHLVSHVHVRDESGINHVFGPDDDVPEWARAKITNPKAWGHEPPRRRGRTFEVVNGSTDVDGLPSFIDVTCQHGDAAPLVARFEATEAVDVGSADGRRPARWVWWWTSALNGPGGPFAADSSVAWAGTGPSASSFGASYPADEQAIVIECKHSDCRPRQRINRRWDAISASFDHCRHAGLSEVSLLALNRISRTMVRS